MGLSSHPNVWSAAEQKGVACLALHSWVNVSLTILSNYFRILKGTQVQGQEGSVGAELQVSIQRKGECMEHRVQPCVLSRSQR